MRTTSLPTVRAAVAVGKCQYGRGRGGGIPGIPMLWYTPSPPEHQTWDRPGEPPCYWHLMAIIGDLLKLVHLMTPSPRETSGGGH